MRIFQSKVLGLCGLSLVAGALALAIAAPSAMAAKHRSRPAKSQAQEVQKFEATEDDGTAQTIHANTKVDEEQPSEEFLEDEAEEAELEARQKMRERAKKARKAAAAKAKAAKKMAELEQDEAAADAEEAEGEETVSASAQTVTAADLKRENAELKKRLAALKKAKIEARAAQQASADAAEAGEEADELAASAAAEPSDVVGVDEVAGEKPAPKASKAVAADEAAANSGSGSDSVEGRVREKALVKKKARAEFAKEQAVETQKQELRERATKFDAVPDKYIPDLAQRLKYTNEILKRFGRAYDYRLMTLADFKRVLAELEAAEEKNSGQSVN